MLPSLNKSKTTGISAQLTLLTDASANCSQRNHTCDYPAFEISVLLQKRLQASVTLAVESLVHSIAVITQPAQSAPCENRHEKQAVQ
eukprot:COSAG01_NODE_3107_length_6575_cov_3.080296_8_plen_87_part_00